MIELREPRSNEELEEVLELRHDLLHRYLGLTRDKPKFGKNDHVIVAVQENEIVGSGILALEGKKGHLRYIVVKREIRGKRIGSMIVKTLEGFAKHKGINRIYVNSRKHAKKFYKQLGYKAAGDYFKHPKTGTLHIRMEKTL